MNHPTVVRTLWACLLLAATAQAAPREKTLAGKVIKASDGDTLWVERNRVTHKVRVLAIDAPETDQPWGKDATKAASDLTLGKAVIVTWRRKDRYGRILGSVTVGGKDFAEAMIRDGHAWLYDAYSRDEKLAALEAEAKAAKRGLWADAEPSPPWEWRRDKKP